jgi:hypothetical protein
MAPTDGTIPIIADDEVEEVGLGLAPVPPDWASRCLYIGEDGARNWLDVLGESTYTLHSQDAYGLRPNRLAALERAEVRTLVSLGPGDGEHDIELVQALRKKVPDLLYIPVEISRGLLDVAIRNLAAHVDVPVGLLGDFERGPAFLRAALDRFARRPILLSMLGGTIGNLDLGEPSFFRGMRALLRPGDSFLIDVPLAGPGWTARDDPRLDKARYTPGFRRFLAGGLAHRDPGLKDVPARAPSWFEERVECRVGDEAAIAGTRVITVRDRPTGRVLLRFRRYDWDALRDWFRAEGFDVLFARGSLSTSEDKFGMGVVLLGHDGTG